jgi:hypothetical protein
MWIIFYKRLRPGWHPWLFMLTVGTMFAALVNAAIAVALLMLWLAVWLVRR